jgi:glycosyltransferase involved in cell wall biosynthesis
VTGNGATRTRLRVAQVITRFIAGAGWVALSGVLALDPEDFEVVFITGEGNGLVAKARAAGHEVVLIPSLRSEIAPADDRRALADLRACLTDFDVVHTHSSKAGALGRMAAHRLEIGRIVHTFHGFPFHQFQSWPRRTAYIAIERSVGRYTDVFLAVGPAVAAEAIARRIAPPERVRTIGVGVVKAPDAPGAHERATARRMLGVPPGMRVVGTVGRLASQKAPEDFVRALAGLGRRDVFGVWIGDGPLRAKIERLARKRGLSDRMLFTGERTDVEVLLPGLDVFAMASRYEGLPCAIVEAMGAGLPVVATAVNAVPDVVIAGETGLLVPPATPELLGRAIGYLIDNPATAARLGAAGRARLGAELSPVALGAVLSEAYRRPDAGAPPARSEPAVSELERRGATWTEERGTSDQGSRRLAASPRRAGDTP